jgi:hypothetical protein
MFRELSNNSMVCPACKKIPNTHSFTYFGKVGETKLFYTSPARADATEDCETRLKNFLMHLEEAKGSPWIWVFDFGYMVTKHHTGMRFTLGLAQYLLENHEHTLQKVILLRTTPWTTFILQMLKSRFTSGIFARIYCMEGDTLELYMNLKKEFQGFPLLWLGKVITLTLDKPLPSFRQQMSIDSLNQPTK